MAEVKLTPGSVVYAFCPDHLQGVRKATIVAITAEPGKTIGLAFDEPVGVHTCDGRCKEKHGLWVNLEHLLTEQEFDLLKLQMEKDKAVLAAKAPPPQVEIVIGEDGKKQLRQVT